MCKIFITICKNHTQVMIFLTQRSVVIRSHDTISPVITSYPHVNLLIELVECIQTRCKSFCSTMLIIIHDTQLVILVGHIFTTTFSYFLRFIHYVSLSFPCEVNRATITFVLIQFYTVHIFSFSRAPTSFFLVLLWRNQFHLKYYVPTSFRA